MFYYANIKVLEHDFNAGSIFTWVINNRNKDGDKRHPCRIPVYLLLSFLLQASSPSDNGTSVW